jgi:hypothetical protein
VSHTARWLALAVQVAALVAICAAYLLVLLHAGPARAQEEPPPERVEAVARICVGEAGWDVASGDCAAIAALLVRRAERLGLRPRAMARAYSRSYFGDPRRLLRRPWIASLTLARAEPGSTAPRGWPSRLPWGRYRRRWAAVVAHAREALRGRVADPCGGEADHWGAPSLDRRALGWQRLDCGPTRNVFWRVPRRDA